MRQAAALALASSLAFVSAALAQVGTGDIYGRVTDTSGAVLTGAAVTLSGPFTRSVVSGSQGDFRFLRLETETYHLTVSMPGFTATQQSVRVTTGEARQLVFRLEVATIEEELTVLAESPVIDTKKLGTQTTVDKAEAVQVPNARDVWAVLRTIPGVVTASTNTGGEQNGQQVAFQGKGADLWDTTWSLDGVQIDDPVFGGAAPTYFDYEFFEEMAVTTGGHPIDVQTGGSA